MSKLRPEVELWIWGKRLSGTMFIDGICPKRDRWSGRLSACREEPRLTRKTVYWSRSGHCGSRLYVDGQPVADLNEAYDRLQQPREPHHGKLYQHPDIRRQAGGDA